MKLSICIPTLNRAAFIGATIDGILPQLAPECEIVILDGGSTDRTPEIVAEYAARCPQLRYVRKERPGGFDVDCDQIIELAQGEFCWLMSDDDLLKPVAIATVLAALRRDLSLIVVNVEGRDFSMSKVLQRRWIDIEADRIYQPAEMERLFVDAADVLRYFASVVVKRSVWLARERRRYYGSWFTYLAVIFQERLPSPAMLIAEPLICYRKGNAHAYSARLGEIWFDTLPTVIDSLTTMSDHAKDKFWMKAPWTSVYELLFVRAAGIYSFREYRRWIRPRLRSVRETLKPTLVAMLPGTALNAFFMAYYTATRRCQGVWEPDWVLATLRESRFHIRNRLVIRRPAART